MITAQSAARFATLFGREARWIVAAPGRVNLIGEHTDYNGGFVLPMAIDRHVVIAADVREGNHCTVRCHSEAFDETVTFDATPSLAPAQPEWANYLRGVVAGMLREGVSVPGMDCVVESNVPLGGGLSSSAALEVATATLIEAVTGQWIRPLTKARLCQRAEHEFAGMPCGLMDQFTSTMGEAGTAFLIDCAAESARLVPIDATQVAVLIIHSNVRHTLVNSPYAERRAQCRRAASSLGVSQLRDVSRSQLEALRDRLDPVDYRRARHVVTENERTEAAAAMLLTKDWTGAGDLMYASHASMRDDFEISCRELDLLVDLAQAVGRGGGVHGSRMTGGGFGGCSVSLVRTEAARTIAESIAHEYRGATGIEPAWFVTEPVAGARVLRDSAPRSKHQAARPQFGN